MARQSYKEEVKSLQDDLLKMGHLVEKSVVNSVKSLAKKDIPLAERIIEEDDIIDDMEHDIEKRSLKLLALQQPVAKDLRVIGTALKIITDLERIADHASDIAKVTVRLEGQPLIKPLIDIPRMAEIAESMIHDVLTAYIDENVELAEEVCRRDDEIDNLFSQIFFGILFDRWQYRAFQDSLQIICYCGIFLLYGIYGLTGISPKSLMDQEKLKVLSE